MVGTNSHQYVHEAQPLIEEFPEKFWVRKPGGAIRRKDRVGVSRTLEVLVYGPLGILSANSTKADGNGLKIHPPGRRPSYLALPR